MLVKKIFKKLTAALFCAGLVCALLAGCSDDDGVGGGTEQGGGDKEDEEGFVAVPANFDWSKLFKFDSSWNSGKPISVTYDDKRNVHGSMGDGYPYSGANSVDNFKKAEGATVRVKGADSAAPVVRFERGKRQESRALWKFGAAIPLSCVKKLKFKGQRGNTDDYNNNFAVLLANSDKTIDAAIADTANSEAYFKSGMKAILYEFNVPETMTVMHKNLKSDCWGGGGEAQYPNPDTGWYIVGMQFYSGGEAAPYDMSEIEFVKADPGAPVPVDLEIALNDVTTAQSGTYKYVKGGEGHDVSVPYIIITAGDSATEMPTYADGCWTMPKEAVNNQDYWARNSSVTVRFTKPLAAGSIRKVRYCFQSDTDATSDNNGHWSGLVEVIYGDYSAKLDYGVGAYKTANADVTREIDSLDGEKTIMAVMFHGAPDQIFKFKSVTFVAADD